MNYWVSVAIAFALLSIGESVSPDADEELSEVLAFLAGVLLFVSTFSDGKPKR